MTFLFKLRSFFAAILLTMIGLSSASASCTLEKIGEFHLAMDGNRALVDAQINGKPTRFLIDTGASNTIITRSAVARLGLRSYRLNGVQFYGVGGFDAANEVTIDELKIAGATVHDIRLIVTGVGLNSLPYEGFLGRDILWQHDIELDFSNKVVRLIHPSGCIGDDVLYWGGSYSMAPIEFSPRKYAIEVYVLLNGHRILAEIDTGADTSIVTMDAARDAGITPQSQGVQEDGFSGGLGAERMKTLVAVFPTFTIGDETIKNAKLRISDLFANDKLDSVGSHIQQQVEGLPEMLLGADFVRAHRIYVAGSQRKIYFSYEGGPIFQVHGPRAEGSGTPATVKP